VIQARFACSPRPPRRTQQSTGTRRDRGINGGNPRLRGEAAVYAAKACRVPVDGEYGVARWKKQARSGRSFLAPDV
jgi:hypothetical protein